jgi:succinoglycan biosynthesis transport protein ExoP
MSIIQFLRIVWARRWVILGGAASCFLGAMLVTLILPPRWEGHSRVMLDLLKPDPVTGQVVASNLTRAYVDTQSELIKDYAVAGRVADDLNLYSDPGLIKLYQHRSSKDKRDFRRWVTQLIVDNTDAKLVEGSNILEITYTGSTPEQARSIADALRKAYIDASRTFRVDQAASNAEWYDAQATKARAALEEAQRVEGDYEKANGIVLEKEGSDVEAARLQALATTAATAAPIFAPPPPPSAAKAELAQVDAMIGEQSKVLGPNHPDLQALRAKRASVEEQVVQEDRANRAAARAATSASTAGIGALSSAIASQRNRVIGQRDKVDHARQLQGETNLRRDLYTKIIEKAAEYRREAAAPVTNVVLLGNAITPQKPKFPNWPLVIGGSLVIGLGFGLGLGLLMELFGRRVRGPEDLANVIDAPVLAIVTTRFSRSRAVLRKPYLSIVQDKSSGPTPPDKAVAA